MGLDGVGPAEVIFKDKLFASEFSVIFLVVVRGQQCVMKVHHGRGPRRYYEPKDRELDIHILETTAYRRLKERGVCEQGIVPQFLGTMDKFDPMPCQPYLANFLNDEYPPSAIFLEYIPNLEMLHLHNYTQARMNNFLVGIRKIHKALVKHGDPKPRNMLIVKDDPERVVWIDFNRANTYDEHTITDREKVFLAEEEETVAGLKMCLPTFQKGDSNKRTYSTAHDEFHILHVMKLLAMIDEHPSMATHITTLEIGDVKKERDSGRADRLVEMAGLETCESADERVTRLLSRFLAFTAFVARCI
ncbi:hypothetical protein EMCG_08538 [[Emmonsia] crescens]|uniref:Protein kinase domain-containing protein n=1 Tax=[Emmonsia] crescens TaxID=73230 RepID=A0A0G2JAF3_9EURO|nr:hypothetical protein EMCG_08538 [Emmonsia crescens UAMH 3008]